MILLHSAVYTKVKSYGLSVTPEMKFLHMSQPELNDMEKIYKNTVDKGIKILSFNSARANADISRNGGFNHCLSV